MIAGYQARVDPARAGLPLTAFVKLRCSPGRCLLRDHGVRRVPRGRRGPQAQRQLVHPPAGPCRVDAAPGGDLRARSGGTARSTPRSCCPPSTRAARSPNRPRTPGPRSRRRDGAARPGRTTPEASLRGHAPAVGEGVLCGHGPSAARTSARLSSLGSNRCRYASFRAIAASPSYGTQIRRQCSWTFDDRARRRRQSRTDRDRAVSDAGGRKTRTNRDRAATRQHPGSGARRARAGLSPGGTHA